MVPKYFEVIRWSLPTSPKTASHNKTSTSNQRLYKRTEKRKKTCKNKDFLDKFYRLNTWATNIIEKRNLNDDLQI